MPFLEAIRGLYPKRQSGGDAAGLSELFKALLTQQTGVDYAELAWNGILYTLSSGLVATPAAGPLGAGGTPLLAAWNPPQSGFLAIVTRAGAFWTAAGTTSGKGFEIDGGPTNPITQATVIRGAANKIGAQPDNNLVGFSAVALTGSSALSRIRPLSGIANGAAAAFIGQPTAEDIRGALVIQPGAVAAITALALGVANEAIAALEYALIDLP